MDGILLLGQLEDGLVALLHLLRKLINSFVILVYDFAFHFEVTPGFFEFGLVGVLDYFQFSFVLLLECLLELLFFFMVIFHT